MPKIYVFIVSSYTTTKGRTTHGASLSDSTQVSSLERQLLEANVVDKYGPQTAVLRNRALANADRH